MSDLEPMTESVAFERRFAELLADFARAADEPFDAVRIAGQAVGAAPRHRPSWEGIRPLGGGRTAWAVLVLLGLLAAVAAGAIALSSPTPVPPALVFAADELVVSLDGRVVAVAVSGGEPRVVADGRALAISPDRTRLVRQAGHSTVVITEASGADLASYDFGPLAPGAASATWSPDGRYIAFAGIAGQTRSEALFALWDVETGGARILPFRHYLPGTVPSWTPDSRYLLLSTGSDLALVNLVGDVVAIVPGTGGLSIGALSPDGRYIVHERWGRGDLVMLSVGSDLGMEVVDSVSRFHVCPEYPVAPDACAPTSGRLSAPSWSPDGRHLAGTIFERMVAVVHRDAPGDNLVLFGGPESGWNVPQQQVQWSPDGERVAFVARDPETGGWAIYVAGVPGGGTRLLTQTDEPPWLSGLEW